MTLWEGARRLPYFFSSVEEVLGGKAVFCPQCVLESLPEQRKVTAHYHVNRSVMCVRCGILIGPINDEEMVLYE
jgi:hypothetical protein